MKKKIIFCILIAALIFSGCGRKKDESEKINILASFYPVYAMALAIGDGCDGIEISCLAAPSSGCLHDYQLTTSDMQKLSDCDLFLINGNGMESFVEKAYEQIPGLNLADTSINNTLTLTEESGHAHDENEAGHSHDVNSHTWLYMPNAVNQAAVIKDSLTSFYPQGEEIFQRNFEDFKAEIEGLEAEKPRLEITTVLFHSGFSYIAEDFGFNVLKVIDSDENTALSAKEQAEVITLIKGNGIKYIFAAEDDGFDTAKAIAQESGAEIIVLDPITRGEGSADAFIEAFRSNVSALKEAFE